MNYSVLRLFTKFFVPVFKVWIVIRIDAIRNKPPIAIKNGCAVIEILEA